MVICEFEIISNNNTSNRVILRMNTRWNFYAFPFESKFKSCTSYLTLYIRHKIDSSKLEIWIWISIIFFIYSNTFITHYLYHTNVTTRLIIVASRDSNRNITYQYSHMPPQERKIFFKQTIFKLSSRRLTSTFQHIYPTSFHHSHKRLPPTQSYPTFEPSTRFDLFTYRPKTGSLVCEGI